MTAVSFLRTEVLFSASNPIYNDKMCEQQEAVRHQERLIGENYEE